jgi:hypothetical protein
MLKYYKLPSIKGEGWAHITINTETGFFATVSDWGNYAYIWTDPGGEFRAFLTRLQPDYLYGKLMMGRPNLKEFDDEATKKEVIEGLDQYNAAYKERHKGKEWVGYRPELEMAENIVDEASFNDWQEETHLDEAHDYACWRPCHDCTGFCERVWPRFVELLKKELYDEKKGHEEAEVLKAAKPAILAEVREHISAMTGPDRNG